MDISRKPVLFHLTSTGQNAIGHLLPGKASFQALVLGTDATGAWILFPGGKDIGAGEPVPVMLVKWEYISTIVFEFMPEPPSVRKGMGFIQSQRSS